MANEIQTARGKIKTKLDILSAVTDFDSIINDCLEQAIPRLKPFFQYKIAEDTSVSILTGVSQLTLPTSGSSLEKLFSRTNTTDPYSDVDVYRQWRDIIYLDQAVGTTTYFKIHATRPFGYTDADLALLATDYPDAMLPLYLLACAEFATVLVGNKRKFNVYQQMNGVRTLSEMQDLTEHYENRAMRMMEDALSAEGQ